MFFCLVMAVLYVTDSRRSVLTGSILLFFGILLRVGYGLSVTPYTRMYLHTLENSLHTPPEMVPTLSVIDPSRSTSTCLTFHTSSQHLVSCQERIVNANHHVFWLEDLSLPC
jgi:hypothetical protein